MIVSDVVGLSSKDFIFFNFLKIVNINARFVYFERINYDSKHQRTGTQ